jgi:hypothetical protein
MSSARCPRWTDHIEVPHDADRGRVQHVADVGERALAVLLDPGRRVVVQRVPVHPEHRPAGADSGELGTRLCIGVVYWCRQRRLRNRGVPAARHCGGKQVQYQYALDGELLGFRTAAVLAKRGRRTRRAVLMHQASGAKDLPRAGRQRSRSLNVGSVQSSIDH